jgi:non-ribosomal peptide synthetase component F
VLLLLKYQNTGDVVFGCVVSGRPPGLPGIEEMVGPFINTQPVRMACDGDERFAAVAERVQQDAFKSAAYGYQPALEAQCASPLNHGMVDHIIAFESCPVAEKMKQLRTLGDGVRIVDVKLFEQTRCDFKVIVYSGADIRVSFTYNRARYGEEMVAEVQRSLREMLAQVAATPDAPVRALRICCEADRSRVVAPLNFAGTAYPSERSVPDLFAEVVRRSPDAVALRYYTQSYSYAQLHETACAVANALRARGIGPGATVGLMTPGCPEMAFGILGTLYCGAAFFPIDPQTSAERVAFVLERDASVLCTVEAFRAAVPAAVAACFLDEAGEAQSQRPPLPPPAIDPHASACIMYTSGSTDQPERRAVSHRDIVRLARNCDYVPFGPHHHILQTGASALDASLFEIWGALLNGAQLCLADQADILDPAKLKALLLDQQITMLALNCELFNQLCEADPQIFAPLRYLLLGGDVLSLRHVERVRAAHPQLELISRCGPTENRRLSTTLDNERADETRVPVGRPIPNSIAYVLDRDLKLSAGSCPSAATVAMADTR